MKVGPTNKIWSQPVAGHIGMLARYYSAQIIATSHDQNPQMVVSKGNPLISGKSRLMKY